MTPTSSFLVSVLLCVFIQIQGSVREVKKSNFEKVTKGKKLIMLYFVPSKGYCDDCEDLYPEFLIAADIFRKEGDILFAKVSDKKLAKALDVVLFPTVLFYEPGSAAPTLLKGDISVDNFVETVKKNMKGDYSDIKTRYTLQLTDGNFEEIIENPNQFSFVILYDKDTEKKELKLFEQLALTFKNDVSLVIARINASNEIKLAGRFAVSRYPAFYWYAKENKSVRKRYGGRMDPEELMSFINDQTKLDRNLGGELMDTAGRVPELDTLVQMYIEEIMEGTDLKDAIKDGEKYAQRSQFNTRFAAYYIDLLKRIQKTKKTDAIEEERENLLKILTRGDPTPRETDEITRKKNILYKFVDEMAMHLIGDRSRSMKILRGNEKGDVKETIIDLHQEL